MNRSVGSLLIISVVIGLIFLLLIIFLKFHKSVVPTIHYHAGFQVYQGEKLVDFSDLKYMHIESCVEDDQKKPQEDDQIEKAHLHNGVGDVVHVHRQYAIWADLFNNLNYPISASASAFLNNSSVNDFKDLPINPYDVLIIVEGTISDPQKVLATAPTKDHILAIEAKSENCGDK